MPTDRIVRTVSILGADGAGKTALVEAFLRLVDARRASPQGSTSRLDAEPEEKKRNFTLSIHAESFDDGGRGFHLLDCPGFASFLHEVDWALRVTDGGVLAISAADEVHNKVERPFDVLVDSRRPALAVATRMDSPDADFERTVQDAERFLKTKVLPIQLPIGAGADFRGIVDLVTLRAHLFEKGFGKFAETDVPEELRERAEARRAALVEAAAESNDELLGKYLESADLSTEEVARGLVISMAERRLLPIACVAAKTGVGVRELLDAMVKLLPDPLSRRIEGTDLAGNRVTREAAADTPFCGQVFRTTIDHYAGRVDYVRIFSGTLSHGAVLMNPRTRTEERIAHFYRTDGAQTTELSQAGPGEMVVLTKLKDAHTGDTLCDRSSPIVLPPLDAASRTFAYAVRADGADDKAAATLQELLEEDPALEIVRSVDSGETVLRGMGQAHLEVAVERVRRKSGIDLGLTLPTPAYRETITTPAKGHGKYKRQTGGHGQYGDCYVEVSPRPRGEGFEFEDAIVGGAIPRQFIPSVERGIIGAMMAGPLAGYPVVDVKATLVFGSYHSVDSSDMAFQVAGSLAFKKAVSEARPILLEPVMALEVRTPEEYVGAVMGDLTSRRARIQGLEPVARGVLIRAICPHAEAMQYDADLRSLTQGAGYFTMEFDHYEPVPAHVAQRIIERRRASPAHSPS